MPIADCGFRNAEQKQSGGVTELQSSGVAEWCRPALKLLALVVTRI